RPREPPFRPAAEQNETRPRSRATQCSRGERRARGQQRRPSRRAAIRPDTKARDPSSLHQGREIVDSRTIGTMEPAQTPTLSSPALTDRVRAFLRQPLFASIATTDATGAARQAVIWYRLEDDDRILVNSRVSRFW